ncbi:hypothetical protein HK104_008071 [Borealophlyctis nickersoniae]|nr:hypothetical protein HK104_008071 [Borealophlyctis nickersoniae]
MTEPSPQPSSTAPPTSAEKLRLFLSTFSSVNSNIKDMVDLARINMIRLSPPQPPESPETTTDPLLRTLGALATAIHVIGNETGAINTIVEAMTKEVDNFGSC